jgi:hypothetical protein
MHFFRRDGRQVQFTEADLKTPLPKKLMFTDPEKIRELARRGEALEGITAKESRRQHVCCRSTEGVEGEMKTVL